MARSGEVISHWYHGVNNYNTSASDFYANVEEAVKRRGIPDVQFSRVDHAEGGVLSAKREYLRIARGRLAFDVCAAPFGKGYFFSWWLTEQPGSPFAALLGCLGLIIAPMVVVTVVQHVLHVPLMLALVAVPLTWWMLGTMIRAGAVGLEDSVMEMPGIGPVYTFVFRPTTYYKVDTTLMYQEAVRGAVMEALDQLTSLQGLRALSPEERRPTMRDLAR